MIQLMQCTVGMVMTNCYILVNQETKEAVMVDPGDQAAELMQFLTQENAALKAILLTHGHFDHMLAVPALREATGAIVYAARKENALLHDTDANLTGSWIRQPMTLEADRLLEDGEEFIQAGCRFRMLLTPGHTAGSCCYYMEEQGWLFSGDTLFRESYGRVDLPTGSPASIGRSICDRLLILPPETQVYPGHGEATSIEHERVWNPAAR